MTKSKSKQGGRVIHYLNNNLNKVSSVEGTVYSIPENEGTNIRRCLTV